MTDHNDKPMEPAEAKPSEDQRGPVRVDSEAALAITLHKTEWARILGALDAIHDVVPRVFASQGLGPIRRKLQDETGIRA